MGQITAMLTSLTAQLTPIATPLAILGVVLWAIAFLATPILPDWATTMKGYFMRAMIVVAVIGFLPGIITAMASMGGGAGG